jgi:hypothetical protein
MRDAFLLRLLVPLVPLVLVACAATSEEPAAQWEGATPHFHLRGALNKETLDFATTGSEAASGSRVWCTIEYIVPRLADGSMDLARARHNKTEIDGYATIKGQERTFEFELMNHSLQADTTGAKVKIVPRVDGAVPPADSMWADWEWHSEEVADIYEGSAQDGTFELRQFLGTPGAGGVVIPSGSGSVGGFFQARWSINESLTISFTVPCLETSIEEE